MALDAPPQKVDTLVDVGDLGLLLRQAQAHRGEYRCRPVSHLHRMLAGAGHQQQPIIGVPNQPIIGLPVPFAFRPLDPSGAWPYGNPVDVLVQHREGHIGQQRGQHAPNAMGNFCFEVTLGYRRLELPRRGERQS
jgi:hypothetical protein